MADDDVATERERLEALAWGAETPPDEAARARLALQALAGSTADHGREARPAPAPPAEPDGRSPRVAGPGAVPDRAAAPVAAVATAAPEATTDGPEARDGGGAGLQAGAPQPVRSRLAGLLWTARPRVWIALGAAATIAVAFAAGTLVGTARDQPAAGPSTTPTPGTVTLEELLDMPQTYADQLPGPVEAPVSLRTTRLVFTNRALDGSAFETPWNVWAGIGTDRSTICLVATANRLESTTACYPREEALHGSVSLSAQSMSGTLTLTLRGGGVQGTVTNEN